MSPLNIGDPQQRGTKSEMATSPLPSRGPGRGRKCYVTPAFSGIPNANGGEQNQKWLPHPCLLGGPKEGGNAMSPLHHRGSPTKRNKIRSGYLTPAFWGGQKRAEMLHHPCILGYPQQRVIISELATAPTFSGAQKREEMLRHPCIFGDPQPVRTKSELATSPLPSRGPGRGENVTSPLRSRGSLTPREGSKIRSGYLTCLLGSPKEGANATSPLHSRGSPTKGNEIRSGRLTPAFSGGQKRAEMLRHPCLLGGPEEGRNATPPRHSQGSPTKGNKIRSGNLTPASWGGQKRAEMLCHPCMLRDPQQRGTKSEVATSPLPSPGPKRRRKCYAAPAFSGVSNTKRGEQNQKWLPHPCLLGGPKEGRNAMLPMHSRGSLTPSAGSKVRSGCLTPAFSGAQKRADMLRHPCILGGPQHQVGGANSEVATSLLPSRGPKRGRKCYITPTFSGVPTAKFLEQNQKWLPHPFILGSPKEKENATSPVHSRGSPTKRREQNQKWSPTKGNKISSGHPTPAFSGAQKRAEMLCHPCILGGPQHQAWGAKSDMATLPLPSRGPKRGRKCYVTPAFSGIPNKEEQNQKWLPHPCLLGGPEEGGNAMSPLHSRGSPPSSAGRKSRSGPQQRGTKSEVATGMKIRDAPKVVRLLTIRGSPTCMAGPCQRTKKETATTPK